MLSEKAYVNPVAGVWGTFERERERLGRQEAEPVFTESSGLDPESLRAGFYELRERLAGASPVIRKAVLFEYLLLNGRISVDPEDWFVSALDHQSLMKEYNTAAMNSVPPSYIKEAFEAKETGLATGYFKTGLDVGHTSPGWRYMLSRGLKGLLKEAALARGEHENGLTAEQTDFYDALDIVYNAIITFTRRLCDMASSMVGGFGDAADARLLSMADSLKNLTEKPPADFHEALQFTYIMHQMMEIEGWWSMRSMGGFDRNFFSYYDGDVKAKKLSEENVKELIKFFFTKFYAQTQGKSNGKNFYFAGQNSDGSNAENELTYVALEAYYEMNTPDPKLSVRFYKNSTDRLYNLIARSIRAGRTSFVLINDEVAIPAIVAQGKTLEDARDFLLIGCYEPAIEGKEIACNMSTYINLPKSVELVIGRGKDMASGVTLGPDTGDPTEFSSYDEFEEAYFKQLKAQIDNALAALREYESVWPLINPSPILAGTFEDAVKKGRDIGQSGPKYNNTGCLAVGIGTTVDSLAAVRQAVFEDSICTIGELTEALYADFEGYEKLRMYLSHRAPKWGTANPKADDIAKKIVEFYGGYVNGTPNNRGGRMVASMFSLNERYDLGKATFALPDGRKRGEPLSLNNASTTGKDTEGVTAYLQSVTCFDYSLIPNGSVTDVYMHPSAIKGDDGLNALISLIKTYFSRGGFGIQFNVFDVNTLIDAQKHPEKYQTLQIRVCGWNVYFVTLSQFEQEQYITANFHSI